MGILETRPFKTLKFDEGLESPVRQKLRRGNPVYYTGAGHGSAVYADYAVWGWITWYHNATINVLTGCLVHAKVPVTCNSNSL